MLISMELQLNGPSEKLDGPFSVTGILVSDTLHHGEGLILKHRSIKFVE